MKTTTAKELTAVRHTQHGLFEDVAKTSEGLMAIMAATKNWNVLSPQRREAIKMITHKLARIGAGDYTHADHWDDIGGYALLGKRDGQNDQPTPSLRSARRKPRKAKKAAKRPARKATKKVRARPAKKARVVQRGRTNRAHRVARPAAPVSRDQTNFTEAA